MTSQRVFLGTDRPALVSAVAYLVDAWAADGWLDLRMHTLVTPGARAARRLRHLLGERTRQDGLRFFPPAITTIGEIPETLYPSRLPFASEWIQQLSWTRAIREVDSSVRQEVFPQIASSPVPYSENDWLDLGRILQRAYRGLAAESLSFADVADQGARWDGFLDQRRWVSMGIIQEKYLSILRQQKLWDRQTARIRAIYAKECTTHQQITLIGVADIGRALRQMLEQVQSRVTALLFAPPEWSDRFDEIGCIRPEAWTEQPIDFRDTGCSFVDSFADQATAVVHTLAAHGDQFARDQVTIGCPDDRLVPHLQRALSNQGLATRVVRGQRVVESGVYRFLLALRQVVVNQTFDAYATLGRHPDVFDWLTQTVSRDWVDQSDAYRARHLPTAVTDRWSGSREANAELIRAFRMLKSHLMDPLSGPAQPMGEWSLRIAKILDTVYRGTQWERQNPEDQLAIGAAESVKRFLADQTILPPDIAPILSAAEFLELMLDAIAEDRVSPGVDPDAIELLGWLELPLDDAPVLILTGLTEGIVPNSNSSDLFLPNGLCTHLNIADNSRRYARDAYALSVLVTSRPHVAILVGRVDDEGEPLRPSRLLFALPDDQVSRRWKAFLSRDAPQTSRQPNAEAENDHATRASASLPESDGPASGKTAPTSKGASTPDALAFRFAIPEPRPDAPEIKALSPTAFRLYLECPYRFYLRYVLGLQEVETESREMTASAFGTLTHAVLEAFGSGPAKDSEDPNEIYHALMDLLRTAARRQFDSSPPAAVSVQLRQLELRLHAFAQHQANVAREGWRIVAVEQQSWDLDPMPQIETPDGSRSLPLRGIIDRIDRHITTGAYRILDYKTSDAGKTPDQTHRSGRKEKRWVDLQLPLYRHIARAMNLEGVDKDPEQLDQLGYILLPKKIGDVGFRMAQWDQAELAQADRVARGVVENVLDRVFWPPGDVAFDSFSSILMTTVSERPALRR